MDNTKELALELLRNNFEFSKVLEENEKFDIYFDKILSAENKYKSDNDIMSLIAFWEDLWNSEGVHNVSYKHAFRLTNLYLQIEDYENALRALHYIDNTPYFEKYNIIYNKLFNQINNRSID